jgi:hypothetical protein
MLRILDNKWLSIIMLGGIETSIGLLIQISWSMIYQYINGRPRFSHLRLLSLERCLHPYSFCTATSRIYGIQEKREGGLLRL